MLRKVAGCEDGTCPAGFVDDDGNVVVQGAMVDCDAIPGMPAHESAVRVPRSLLVELAARLEERVTDALTPEEFQRLFDRFAASAFRLETLPTYSVPGEVERIRAWRAGEPRPERSVRTSEWLRRIAVTTAKNGREWSRVRVVELPLSEYVRYQATGYAESQTAGERILVAVRTPELDRQVPPGDFWLFDADAPDAVAAAMSYDADGRFLGAELHTERNALDRFRAIRDAAWAASVPLNVFLATTARFPERKSA